MFLDTTSKKLQLVLGAVHAVNGLPIVVDYVDMSTGTAVNFAGVSNGITAVDIVPIPGSGVQFKVNGINVHNSDTIAHTVTIRMDVGAGVTRIVFKALMAVNDFLIYTDAGGWTLYDSSGAQKNTMTGAGRFLGTTVFTSGSGNFTTGPNTTQIRVRLLGGGGAGGGGGTVASGGGAGGGGGSGGYAEKTFTVAPNTAYAYVVGAAGVAGAAGANPGGVGGNTTFIVGATTVTAFGGNGGTGMAAGTTVLATLGGAPASISTNGDVNGSGMPGNPGIRMSGTVGVSGAGGDSIFGAGHQGLVAQGTGGVGTGRGAGGSGGLTLNAGAATAGGAGTTGLIVVDEFS